MTTILDEFRRLEEARKRGDIDKENLAKRRQELTEMVEEAELASGREAEETDTLETQRDPTHSDLLRFTLLAIGGLIVCVLLGSWVFRDPTLALTLGVTVLAAIVIRASNELED
jgi:hypothetical protein